MKKRLASLFLLLMLAGSTVAGVPMHSGNDECSMHDMHGMHGMDGMMDCCKAALMANNSPEIALAKLCCAVDCQTNGSTSSKVGPLKAPASVQVPDYAVTPRPHIAAGRSVWRNQRVHGPPDAPPTYLLNLAFLI
jgi:hypothetical protein